MFGWKRVWEAERLRDCAVARAKMAEAERDKWKRELSYTDDSFAILCRTATRYEHLLAGRAATIRRLLEEVRDAASRERIADVLICESGIRADKAEAELSDERANRRHWEQTAGETNEELARVRAERDAALEALHTIAERFGEVARLLEDLRKAN